MEWSRLHDSSSSRTGPRPRGSAGMAAVKNGVLVCGGCDRTPRAFNDFFHFNIDRGAWNEISPRIARSGYEFHQRSGHAVWSMKDGEETLYIHGGTDPTSGRTFSDTFRLDLRSNELEPLSTLGDVPTPRHSHSVTRFGSSTHKAFLFGGASEDDGPLDESFIFDTRSLMWEKVPLSANAPAKREMHSLCCFPDSHRIVLYGGRDDKGALLAECRIFDCDDMTWSGAELTDIPLCAHEACPFDSDTMLLYGGFDGETTTSAISLLSLHKLQWTRVVFEPHLLIPPPRFAHSMTKVWMEEGSPLVIVFGGVSFEKDHGDLWMLRGLPSARIIDETETD